MPDTQPIRFRGARQLRKGRRSIQGQIYHVTTVTAGRIRIFDDLVMGRLLVRSLRREENINNVVSVAYVVMPDHLHWLLQLPADTSLSSDVSNVKSLSARQINKQFERSGPIWHRGFYDRAIRSEEDVISVARYIVSNPLRAGLVDNVGAYSLWDAIWIG